MRIAFVFNRKSDDSPEQAEFDTPETIRAIHEALASGEHEVFDIDMSLGGSFSGWLRELAARDPQIIFNTAEGFFGSARESVAPGIFEQLGLPYVGSGPHACMVTMDKALTKRVVADEGVPVIEGRLVRKDDDLEKLAAGAAYPSFVKPNFEGSSKGISARSICQSAGQLKETCRALLGDFPEGVLVERYVPGRDLAVSFISGVGNDGMLEPVEYSYSDYDGKAQTIYDDRLKTRGEGEVVVRCPANIDWRVRDRLHQMMRRIVRASGVVDFARADFRLADSGEVYFLEINALPSLQPGAGLFEASKLLGLDYGQTILKILEAGLRRHGLIEG